MTTKEGSSAGIVRPSVGDALLSKMADSEGESPSFVSKFDPPWFSGNNYIYWKARMRIYLQALDYEVWRVVENGPHVPTKTVGTQNLPKEKSEWNITDRQLIQLNAKAMHNLYCALDQNEFIRIFTCESAKEIWDRLEMIYEGTRQVKEIKISMLEHAYELFRMKSEESISDMFTRFTDIINALEYFGKTCTNVDNVSKILRSLPNSWEPKVTAIRVAKDLRKLGLDELLSSLKSYEEETKQKKSLALESSHYESNDDIEDDESEEDEEIAMIFEKLDGFLKKKRSIGRRPFKRDVPREESSKKEPPTCFHCQKPGHIRAECPQLKKETKNEKKVAMKATWDDEFII